MIEEVAMHSKLTFSEDGSLKIDNETECISYHKSLNVVIVTCRTGKVKVIDLPSGLILRECQLVGKLDHIHGPTVLRSCKYKFTTD